MRLRTIRGDLLAAGQRCIAHGVNAQGKMHRGVALHIRDRYPGVFDAYIDAYRADKLQAGRIVPWIGPDRVVLNLVTQEFYGRGQRFVDYAAIRRCFATVEKGARRHQEAGTGFFHDQPELAIPMIGSDRGGGDWEVISAIIEEEVSSVQVFVYRL